MISFADAKAAVDIRQFAEANLEPSGRTFVCPCCGSGSHANHTSALSIQEDRQRWHCFSCGEGGDVIDLAEWIVGTKSKRDALAYVANWAGLEDLGDGAPVPKPRPRPREPEPDHSEGRRRERDYLAECRGRIGDPRAVRYLQSRGITMDEALDWGLGFDPRAGGAKRGDGTWAGFGRITIPWMGSDYYHNDRAIDPSAKERKYTKPRSSDVGPQPLWNPSALMGDSFVVVEGPMDALAIRAVGGQAVALGGTGGRNALVRALRDGEGDPVVIVGLDTDGPGQDATLRLEEGLDAIGIRHVRLPPLPTKDAGDMLAQGRREELAAILARGNVLAREEAKKPRMRETRQPRHDSIEATRESQAEGMGHDGNPPRGNHVRRQGPMKETGYTANDGTERSGIESEYVHIVSRQMHHQFERRARREGRTGGSTDYELSMSKEFTRTLPAKVAKDENGQAYDIEKREIKCMYVFLPRAASLPVSEERGGEKQFLAVPNAKFPIETSHVHQVTSSKFKTKSYDVSFFKAPDGEWKDLPLFIERHDKDGNVLKGDNGYPLYKKVWVSPQDLAGCIEQCSNTWKRLSRQEIHEREAASQQREDASPAVEEPAHATTDDMER